MRVLQAPTRSIVGATICSGLILLASNAASASTSSQPTEGSIVSVVVGEIAAAAVAQFPDSFGDIHINDSNDVTVDIVGQGSALMAYIDGVVGSSIHVNYVEVRYSATQLRTLAQRVASDDAALSAEGVQIVSLVPDALAGTVDAMLQTSPTTASSTSIAATQAIVDARYGAGLVSIDSATGLPSVALSTCPSGCRTNDYSPFYGGDSVTFQIPGHGNWFCSTGFGVLDSNGKSAVLSAGHCAEPGDTVSINCDPPYLDVYCPVRTVGSVGPSYYAPNSGLDFEAIDTSGSGPFVYGGSPTSTSPPVNIVNGSVMQASGSCCLTVDGASTGEISANYIITNWTCQLVYDEILNQNYTVCGLGEVENNGNPNLGICRGGDSGGPVYEHTGGSYILAEGLIESGSRSLDGKTYTRCFFEQLSVVTSGATGIKLDG